MSKRKASDDDPVAIPNGSRTTELAAHVKALNSQFSSWIKSQESLSSDHLWIAGVEDYVKHAKKIQSDFADVIEGQKSKKLFPDSTIAASTTRTSATAPPSDKPASFGSFPSFAPATSTAAPAATFQFGGPSTTSTTTPSLFGSTAPTFGASTASFGAGKTGGLFSFPAAPAATTPAGDGDGGDGEEGEEEDGGAKFDAELQKDEGSNVLFQAKGKATVKNGDKWDTKGTGQLSIRAVKGTERHFVSLVTDAGRSLMTGTITKMSKPTVPQNEGNTKSKRLLVNLVMEHEGKTQGWLTMLTVGNEQVREELRVKLTQLSS